MNFFQQWAVGSVKQQTLSQHILMRTASEKRRCSAAASCCGKLVGNQEKYLEGQKTAASWHLGRGAAKTRRAAQPSSIHPSFAFCLKALRSLQNSRSELDLSSILQGIRQGCLQKKEQEMGFHNWNRKIRKYVDNKREAERELWE